MPPTASAEKLVADAEHVRDLGIVMWTSEIAAPPDGQKLDWRDDGGRFKDALGRRLPQVFETNGIDVLTFNAALWDSSRKRIVWRGSATLALARHQPFLQTQDFAGQLLNAMQADGLVALKPGHAVGNACEKITEYPPSAADR